MVNMFISRGFEDAPTIGSGSGYNGSLLFMSRKGFFVVGLGTLV